MPPAVDDTTTRRNQQKGYLFTRSIIHKINNGRVFKVMLLPDSLKMQSARKHLNTPVSLASVHKVNHIRTDAFHEYTVLTATTEKQRRT